MSASAADSRRVFCNVFDQRHLCRFRSPALVARGLRRIALSSKRAAPVRARQVRARSESRLDPSLGVLAQLLGRAANTPCAINENGSRTQQRVLLSRLDAQAENARVHATGALVALIIGTMAALARDLHWFGAAPTDALDAHSGGRPGPLAARG